MQKIGYWVSLPFLWMVSWLPFKFMYALSDFVAFIICYVIGYRKKMVIKHLKMAIPNVTDDALKQLLWKTYQHFSDNFLELNKALTANQKQIINRFRVTNPELVESLGKRHKNIMILYSHHGSYEWTTILHHYTKVKNYIVYKKLNNPYFNQLVNKIRTKFGAHLVLTTDTYKLIKRQYKDEFPKSFGFVSDQSPMLGQERHWSEFFGVEVPIFTGAEDIAKKLNMPVVFMNVQKVKRGYYEAEFELMAEDPNAVPKYQLMDDYYRRIEKQILQSPSDYLWTHNRWKHAGKKQPT